MGIPLSEAAKKAIDANNFAHVATLMKDGSPQVSPVWIYRDGDDVMRVLAPFDAVTVLYGHIHRENHMTHANAQHHASPSLIFGFPDPSVAEKKPLPFDKDHPFNNLGAVEITSRQLSGTEGIQQLLREVTL